ncbi:MAG: carboxypeptidase regulatory-like domain-containing protein [Candidatus Tectomicrobia bacterium]|uniref:Carboxypeptidase regulatory-like domain-containing protein n=1 Tax=Tectimicrobiota bacterium TaxID=2528274 RepID=A0A932G098_UNCTE|nr:carboxypeptidase regulatory-like domain-containing protein [Candidatus Tectomicrobia bacterium]
MKKRLVAGIACCFVLGMWLATVQAYEAVVVSKGGSISGTVKYEGIPPTPGKLEITRDHAVCGSEAKDSPDLIVNSNKEIKNAVVYLANISQGKAMDETDPVLDQKGCKYVPHVMVMPAGGKIWIQNSDGILHHIHLHSRIISPISYTFPKFKKKIAMVIEHAEIIPVRCDVHGWMKGVIVAAGHPYYAVTNDNGAFRLTDVPPGKYQVKVWHETLGEQTREIEVTSGADAHVHFELASPPGR